MDGPSQPARSYMLPRLVLGLAEVVLFLLAWFGLAGTWAWWRGWAFFGVFVIYISILVVRLAISDPDLLRERNQPGENVEAWDRVLMAIYSLLMLVLLAVAALDNGRFGWSHVPAGMQALGWALIAVTGAMIWHVMSVNRFLSGYARLQPERGQVVVSQGLYGFIRHPMYLGIILGVLGIPLVLGSWWALIPAGLVGLLEIYRTAREDRMLQQGLLGYGEYCQQVPWRLVPKVW